MIKSIKPFSLIQKIVLSLIPFLVVLFFLLFFVFRTIQSYEVYITFFWILFFSLIFQSIFLIRRIWKTSANKSLKTIYIVLILSTIVFHFIYIWTLDVDLVNHSEANSIQF